MKITLPEIRAALERNGVNFVEDPQSGNTVKIRVDGAVITFDTTTGNVQVQSDRQEYYEQMLTIVHNDPVPPELGKETWFSNLKNNPAARIALGAAAVTVGYVAAPVLLTYGFSTIGLSATGPVAGGWFAGTMGPGLTAMGAGGYLATLQSAAMTASTYTTASWVGSAVTGFAASQVLQKNEKNEQSGNEQKQN